MYFKLHDIKSNFLYALSQMPRSMHLDCQLWALQSIGKKMTKNRSSL